jgi:acetyl/propionyl-CoA carboxylase alpha subunit
MATEQPQLKKLSYKQKKYIENRDAILAKAAKERQEDPLRFQQADAKYRDSHKEQIAQKDKEYREAHLEEIKAKKKAAYEQNKSAVLLKQAEYRQKKKQELQELKAQTAPPPPVLSPVEQELQNMKVSHDALIKELTRLQMVIAEKI